MTAPDPNDVAVVIERVRRDGAVMWPITALPDDFLAWRRRIRAAAKKAQLRISVRRVNDIAFIEHVDHEVTDDQFRALGKVMHAQLEDRELSWDDALRQAARDRMTVLPDQDQVDHDD